MHNSNDNVRNMERPTTRSARLAAQRFRRGGLTASAGANSLLKALCLLPALLFLLCATGLRAQRLEGFTAPGGRVLLMWGPDSTTPGVRYNVYRKPAATPAWPGTPLNGTPLGPVTNCPQFKTIIPEGSNTWKMLSYALADSTGGVPPVTPLANVCTVTSLPVGSDKWRRLQVFAGFMPTVARAMGQGYEDNTATAGQAYTYRIVRVGAGGTELAVLPGSEITITAGTPGAIPTPGGVQGVAGDSKVQVLWNIPASVKFQGFDVQRALAPGGPWTRVSDVDFSATISSTINQDTLVPDRHGFTDYQRYDSAGNPVSHAVPNPPGADVNTDGPRDGVTYHYRVRHKDPLGNGGAWSGVVSATPRDSARPGTPQAINVTAIESSNGFQIRWNRVALDIEGHKEGVRGYRIYRYEEPEDPTAGATAVGGIVNQPGDTSLTVTMLDTSPGLRSSCGDKTWYYRVEALDSAGNVSFRSIAVGDALKDTTRPDNVQGTEAEGFDDFIKVRWDLNTDCDISEYRIYRAYCNYGDWLPCPDSTYDRETQEVLKKYIAMYNDQPGTSSTTRYDPKKNPRRPYDCGGPFELIGTITHEEARARRESAGKAFFDDNTVPTESPICYAYLVKAVDRSQNESGIMPIPDPTKEIIVCQRLRDRTPPGPGIIAGLFARDSAVIVEWIGPPVQDIAAYHVYRAEKEDGPYVWAGGRTVVPPPATGTVLTAPWTPPGVVGCESVPLVSRDWMSAGRITDTVEPRDIWWYKVVGIDQQGNETPTDSAVAISTFTFKSNREQAPEITSVSAMEGPCALEIQWTPAFDAGSTIGFAVFRCLNVAGDYHQVGNVVQGSSFTDNTVARNVTYWYRVAMLKKDGSLSRLSDPKHGVHP